MCANASGGCYEVGKSFQRVVARSISRALSRVGGLARGEKGRCIYSSSLYNYTSRFRDIPPFGSAPIFIFSETLHYLDAILKQGTVIVLYSLV